MIPLGRCDVKMLLEATNDLAQRALTRFRCGCARIATGHLPGGGRAIVVIRPRSAANAPRPRRRGDRMIQSHSTHPAASSVTRWLTICLQWLLFQQMHYYGSEGQ